MSQVVIIGAGPTGLTLALLLVRQGIDVTLIEASRNFRRTFRGEALMPSGLEAIDLMGLTDLVAQSPHRPLTAWEFIIENRSIFRVDEPMEAGGKSCTLISQPAFLEGVMAKVSEYPNFEFIAGSGVKDLLWERERASGVILADNRQITADLVVGADGRNSIVRQKANLALDLAAQSYDILWFKLASTPELETENIFYSVLCGDAAFGLFLGSEGQLQVGWSLNRDTEGQNDLKQWRKTDWVETLAAAAPDWLAGVFRQQADTLERPFLLSVTVGLCPQWHAPGVLLLGDAAHPMSPIRAQGINMALRDAIVAVNHLVPALKQSHLADIDAVLPQIQAERQPEIVRIQQLQRAEIAQGELLHDYPPLRYLVSRLVPRVPLLRNRIRQSWIDRQLQLRKGFTQVSLQV
jgi:2-polyprenyl-6-methoxyphenol hydroxylase-like FAD-dependent oxidoreductase